MWMSVDDDSKKNNAASITTSKIFIFLGLGFFASSAVAIRGNKTADDATIVDSLKPCSKSRFNA